MTSDIDIINALDAQREAAADRINNPFQPRNGPDPFDPIRDAMKAHPEFCKEDSHLFHGKQIAFFPHQQAVNLMRVSLKEGSAEALRWYRRVRATRVTGVRVVATIHGLWMEKPISLSNGISLMGLRDLPDSRNSRWATQAAGIFDSKHAAAVVEIGTVGVLYDAGDDAMNSHKLFLNVMETIRDTVTAFVLSPNAAPTVGEAWQEFIDPEMEAAEYGYRSWQKSLHEGRHPNFPTTADNEMIEWVEKYLHLAPDVARKCRVPLERLNLARRRLRSGDMAIDGSVGFEALLLPEDDSGELVHKLSTRTALLLGKSLVERQAIQRSVKKFYNLRSKFVHGKSSKLPGDHQEIVREGLRLLHMAIQEVIKAGVAPEPGEWELTGGPPNNRFHVQQKPGDPVSLTDQTP